MSKKTREKRSRKGKAGKASKASKAGKASKAIEASAAAKAETPSRTDEREADGCRAADERDVKLDEASGAIPGPPPERRATMQPDMIHPDGQPDLRDGAASIAPVTDAMMDHAAHEAALLADSVARGTATVESAAEQTVAAARDTAEDAAQTTVETGLEMSHRAVEAGQDAARNVAEAATELAVRATDGAAEMAEHVADGAKRAAERGAEAARDALSASGDALAQYNDKIMEMVRSNLASTTELFSALVQAKSVPEAMSLNADHFRRRMEALTTQGRDLANLAQRIAFDALRPFARPADR